VNTVWGDCARWRPSRPAGCTRPNTAVRIPMDPAALAAGVGSLNAAAAAVASHLLGRQRGSQRSRATTASACVSVTGTGISLVGTVREQPSRKTTWSFMHARSSG
jgi:hypothetical protein